MIGSNFDLRWAKYLMPRKTRHS